MGLVDLRRQHLSLVLAKLLRDGPLSRAQLSTKIGLTKATTSTLVADLLGRGLVAELPTRLGGAGRPAIAVSVTGHSVIGLGMRIEADDVAACAVNLAGDVVSSRHRRCDNRGSDPATVLRRLARITAAVVDDVADSGRDIVGACLAVPGLVDREASEIVVAPNLDWARVELAGLDLAFGLGNPVEVTVDNEANFGALAELECLSDEAPSFLYVSGGSGVGAGVVIDGHLMRGFHGFGGEIGHLVVDPHGSRCACGARGCLETVVGEGRRAGAEARAEALARALTGAVHLLDPSEIVLGGTFGDDPTLAEMIGERLHSRTLAGRWRPCPVRTSTLGADAALLGAARHALRPVLADPTVVPTQDTTDAA